MHEYKLSELLLEKNQGVNTTTEKVSYSSSGIPVLRAQDIGEFKINFNNLVYVDVETFQRIRSQCKPKKGDVLYTNIGSQLGFASVYDVDSEVMIAWNVLKMKPNKNFILPEYLAFCLNEKSFRNFIRSINSSSTMPFVSGATLDSLTFKIPSIDIQKEIVNKIQPLTDKIELNNQMNETLEAMARAIFKEWFIDFGPVRAKAEGRRPFGMDDETAALFPDSFEESELGMIPKGWRVGSVSDFFEVNPKCQLIKGMEYNYIEMKDLNTLSPSISSWRKREFSSGSRFSLGDTLVARISPCLENGKIGFVDFMESNEVGWGSTEFVVIRSKGLIPKFASYLLSIQDTYRAFLVKSMQGTSGRQRTPDVAFSGYRLTLPDIQDQIWKKFNDACESKFQLIKNNSVECVELVKLRDLILPKLISGEFSL